MLIRGLQACYNGLKSRQLFHFHHGDSLIFILASAQIMYGYALQPKSIPSSFYKFISKTGPIPEAVLELNRTVVRAKGTAHLDMASALDLGMRLKATPNSMKTIRELQNPVALLPCALMHGIGYLLTDRSL